MSSVKTNTATGGQTAARSSRRVRSGVVKAAGRQKTIRVECPFTYLHSKYGKLMKGRTSLHVHDPENQAKVGDRVEIAECRPISKTKRWRLLKVLTAS